MAELQWLVSGREVFPAMLAAIEAARWTLRLETYIYTDGELGRRIRDALVNAQRRGVRVQVLVDSLGSWLLPDDFFAPVQAAGGEVRFFNPLRLWRLGVRDHRKLLVCDDRVVFAGGFNVSDEYAGDGITHGWRDVGFRLEAPDLARPLTVSFDELFALADFQRRPLLRLRAFAPRRRNSHKDALPGQILLSRPGLGATPLMHALRHDLKHARDIRIITAYFLPTWKIRRDLIHAARRGARVQLILAGKSDVLVARLAARHLYARLLRAGVEIYEYEPQVLHTKFLMIDGLVYAGSANLDIRSLKLNYELVLRFDAPEILAGAEKIWADHLRYSRRIEPAAWRESRTYLQRLESGWAYFLLARVDRYLALKQFRAVRE